jgi:hypothetical protein
MSESAATVFAALIGAVLGSLGTQLFADRLQRVRERQKTMSNLAQLYLLQVKDATRSLWFRLYNIVARGGLGRMDKEYYIPSMLFTLGSLLAYKRLLLLHGTYSVMEEVRKGWGTDLQLQLERLDTELDNELYKFYRYDRLALAEAVTRWDDGRSRVASSLEFRSQYERVRAVIDESNHEDPNYPILQALKPAEDFVTSLRRPSSRQYLLNLMMQLLEIERVLEPQSRFPELKWFRTRLTKPKLYVRIAPTSGKVGHVIYVFISGLLAQEEVEPDEQCAPHLELKCRDGDRALFSLKLPAARELHKLDVQGRKSQRKGSTTFTILPATTRKTVGRTMSSRGAE